MDEDRRGRREEHPVVEGERALLFGAAGEEQQAIGCPGQQLGDLLGAPAPAPVRARLAEAILVSVVGHVAAAPQLVHER